MQDVDVPVVDRISVALYGLDGLEDRRDLRTAGLDATEELLLVDLTSLGGMRQEDDLGQLIPAAQELYAPVENSRAIRLRSTFIEPDTSIARMMTARLRGRGTSR